MDCAWGYDGACGYSSERNVERPTARAGTGGCSNQKWVYIGWGLGTVLVCGAAIASVFSPATVAFYPGLNSACGYVQLTTYSVYATTIALCSSGG